LTIIGGHVHRRVAGAASTNCKKSRF
jgi:hypothetical protein